MDELNDETATVHIYPLAPREQGGWINVEARVELPDRTSQRLWYQIPEQFAPYLSSSHDSFVAAMLFPCIRKGAAMHVHGQVSPSLLSNLSEFQAAWHCWRPDKYQTVEITVDSEREDEPAENAQAVCLFSGGIDGAFSIFRHVKGRVAERWRRKIGAGLFVHGFDVPLSMEDEYAQIASRAEETLASLDVPLIRMRCNYREFDNDWSYAHGAVLGSCLMLLKRQFREGMIGSSDAYNALGLEPSNRSTAFIEFFSHYP